MHVLHVAAEFAPIAKAGGLGDVLLGLCRELLKQNHTVDILIPKYDCMRMSFIRDFRKVGHSFESYFRGKTWLNGVYEGYFDDLKLTFIHPEPPLNYFDRGAIYAEHDDIDRFSYFSKACVDYIEVMDLKPDIVQIHDWQTGLIPLLINGKMPVVQTIHNLQYQGKCDQYHLDHVGLVSEDLMHHHAVQDPGNKDLANFLKAGIVYSQAVVTVSPTYSKEILTEQKGEGLEIILRLHQEKLHGILNGIDYTFWDPTKDTVLPIPYSVDNLQGKAELKQLLKKNIGLSPEHKPLVCCISRLVPQKGIDLIKRSIYRTLEKGGQFLLIGSSPIEEINQEFHRIKHEFRDNNNLAMVISFEHELVHWAYAGCDMIVVPSLFEPCGLTQLIALRYGTIPIVRKTGGLADTIFDIDEDKNKGNGFTFVNSDTTSLDFALDRALGLWQNSTDGWTTLVKSAMKEDHSWSHRATHYMNIYEKLVSKK
jgi:starch synthase